MAHCPRSILEDNRESGVSLQSLTHPDTNRQFEALNINLDKADGTGIAFQERINSHHRHVHVMGIAYIRSKLIRDDSVVAVMLQIPPELGSALFSPHGSLNG
jgi:hypothetical protein